MKNGVATETTGSEETARVEHVELLGILGHRITVASPCREDRGWPSLRSFNSISAFAPSMCKESVRKGVIVLKTSQGSHCWSGIVFKVRGVSAVTPE